MLEMETFRCSGETSSMEVVGRVLECWSFGAVRTHSRARERWRSQQIVQASHLNQSSSQKSIDLSVHTHPLNLGTSTSLHFTQLNSLCIHYLQLRHARMLWLFKLHSLIVSLDGSDSLSDWGPMRRYSSCYD